MIEDFISKKEQNSEEMAELNGLIIRRAARIETLKAALRQVSSYTEILERCIEDKEGGIKIMVEELMVIVNELYESKCEAMSIGETHAYSHAIRLLNDLIDKHEGVKGEG